ncbi:MAG: hypothetical protein AB1656_23635 [Candidatus Omnitrophota bacterium]
MLTRRRFQVFITPLFFLAAIFIFPSIADAQPTARIDGGLFYFPPSQSLLMLGGWGEANNWQAYQEVWALSAAGWNALTDMPIGMTHTSAAYDPINMRLVAMTGVFSNQADTYAYDGAAWKKIVDQPIFPNEFSYDPELIFDASLGKIVLLYGNGTDSKTYILQDSSWTALDLNPHPPAAYDAVFVYDEKRLEGVLFTGQETWIWKNQSWTKKSPAHSPSCGPGDFNMVFDSARGVVVLFAKGQQTWTWDGADWTQLHPANSPPNAGRGFFAMGYDPNRSVAVIYGGEIITDPVNYSAEYYDDIWEWDGVDWRLFTPGTPVSEWSLF